MAVTNIEIIVSAKDLASATLGTIGRGFSTLGDTIKANIDGGAIAATGLLGTIGFLGKGMVEMAANMEQTGVAFKTLIGNTDKAKTLLGELSDFARSTPFDLPQVQDGAKRLLAYGIESEKIIPTFKMLGDISAGNKDKLNALILAYGQVSAATKLTGAELRQFTEAGVPLLEALVNQANETGGVLTSVGGASKETTKKMASLASSIANTEFEMSYFKKTGGKTDEQLKNMQKTLDLNKAKLAQFGDVGQTVYKRVKVTAEDMFEKISDGSIKFDQVHSALGAMTQEGGRFFGMMEEQSKTFNGRISNIRDTWVRFATAIVGVDVAGDIRNGSLFDVLSKGAFELLKILERAQEPVTNFFNALISNKDFLVGLAGAFGGLITLIGIAFVSTFGGAIATMAIFAGAGVAIAKVLQELDARFGIFQTLKDIFANLPAVIDTVKTKITDTWNSAITLVQPVIDKVNDFKDAFVFGDMASPVPATWTEAFNKLKEDLEVVGGFIMSIFKPVWEQLKQAIDQLTPTFILLMDTLRPIWEAISTFFIPALMEGVGAILVFAGAILTGALQAFIALLTGIIQITVGIISAVTGLFEIVIGLFTGNGEKIKEGWNLLWRGIWESVKGFATLTIGVIYEFVEGIIKFFQNLFDVLIGHSIIPDMVDGIIGAFGNLKDAVFGVVGDLVSGVTSKFEGLVNSAKEWGKGLVGNIVGGIRDKVQKAGALKDKLLGELGVNMSDLLNFDTGGVVPGPIGQPRLATVHGGEVVTPYGGGSGGGGGSSVNITVHVGLYAGSETEKRNIARELYSSLVRVAKSQNKSVSEFMGG